MRRMFFDDSTYFVLPLFTIKPFRSASLSSFQKAVVNSCNRLCLCWTYTYNHLKYNSRNNWNELIIHSTVQTISRIDKETLTVRCVVWFGGVVGPYFFENYNNEVITVYLERNDDHMITDFFTLLGQHVVSRTRADMVSCSWRSQLATEIVCLNTVRLFLRIMRINLKIISMCKKVVDHYLKRIELSKNFRNRKMNNLLLISLFNNKLFYQNSKNTMMYFEINYPLSRKQIIYRNFINIYNIIRLFISIGIPTKILPPIRSRRQWLLGAGSLDWTLERTFNVS